MYSSAVAITGRYLRTISALQVIKGRVLAILSFLFAHEEALKFIALE